MEAAEKYNDHVKLLLAILAFSLPQEYMKKTLSSHIQLLHLLL